APIIGTARTKAQGDASRAQLATGHNDLIFREEMVDATGIEPVTPSMSTKCSPAELRVRRDGPGGTPGREGAVYNPADHRTASGKRAGGRRDSGSGGDHAVDLGDEVAQMHGL